MLALEGKNQQKHHKSYEYPYYHHTNHNIWSNMLTKSFQMDVPRFGGFSHLGWIFKINQFVNFHQVPDNQ